MTISYCTKCGKESCQHGGWTSRSDEVLMRQALEVLEGMPLPSLLEDERMPCCDDCAASNARARAVIDALNERLLQE